MKPTFSEFSYGFALTHELCRAWYGQLRAAPVFPSLIEEGRAEGGYDMHLRKPGGPLFLQFKISECMVRETAAQWDLFKAPYYRFWLHAERHSRQHQMLLDRDVSPNVVLYAAPVVHEVEDLDAAFVAGAVVASSVFFRPRDIGRLPDRGPHCIAFIPGQADGYFCSDPQRVNIFARGDDAFGRLTEAFRDRPPVEPTPTYFDELAESLESIAIEEIAERAGAYGELSPEVSELDILAARQSARMRFIQTRDPLRRAQQRAAYAVRTVLGAELLWVAESAPAT